jgi:GNAT superfamily N-acetyltransferase
VIDRDAFRVVPVDEPTPDSAPPEALLGRPGFYFAKLGTTDVGRLSVLTTLGFHVVDVNLTLERRPESDGGRPAATRLRDAEPRDADAVLAIAESCFICSRFHLDPEFPDAIANRIKREWVRSYLEGRRGERLLVAEREGKPVGFLAALQVRHQGALARVIDLIGVATDEQGRGVGRDLVQGFITGAGRDVELLRVGTQAANIRSVRLYEQCGFRLAESSYVLHAHRSGDPGSI